MKTYPQSRLDLTKSDILSEEYIKRFWSKVEKTENSWLWNFSLDGMGYGSFVIFKNKEYKTARASRMSFYLTNGPIPDGMCVCHSCDNPKCVRPDHLWLGTRSQNSKDMAQKGRNPTLLKSEEILGEDHPRATLKNCEVALIKKLFSHNLSQTFIAKMFKTTKHTIFRIKHGHQWGHVSSL